MCDCDGRAEPVYVSWTLKEGSGQGRRSGESVVEAFDPLADLDLDGFLFNCTHPDAIEAAIEVIFELTNKPTGGCCGIGPEDIAALNGALPRP